MAEEDVRVIKTELAEIKALLLTQKRTLTIEECAAYTGYGKDHIYRLTSQRQIPFYKPMGGKIYFDRQEIDEWLLRNRQATNDEISSKATTYVQTNPL